MSCFELLFKENAAGQRKAADKFKYAGVFWLQDVQAELSVKVVFDFYSFVM